MSDHAPKPDNENAEQKVKKDQKGSEKKDKDHKNKAGGETREHQEECLDDALEDTFPASDPISPQDPSKPGRG